MPPRERAVDRGARLARHDLATVGHEFRTSRVASGLTLAEVGAATGMSPSQVGRIERANHPAVTVTQLARVGAVVGLDVRVRVFQGANATRDAGQLRVMRAFRERLHANLRIVLEVPVVTGDQRAWDGVLTGFTDRPGAHLPAEFDSVLYDFQAQVRRLMLKASDSGSASVLWVVAATRRNRRVLGENRSLFTDTFPLSARTALRALGAGHHPNGSALILL